MRHGNTNNNIKNYSILMIIVRREGEKIRSYVNPSELFISSSIYSIPIDVSIDNYIVDISQAFVQSCDENKERQDHFHGMMRLT